MNCSQAGSSVHGIFQARILEWVAISFSSRSSRPRDRTHVPALQADALTSEPPGKPKGGFKHLLIREGRGYRNRRNNQRLVQPPDRVLVPIQKNINNNVFEFFYRTGAPTQVEDGNLRLNTRFLEHSSVPSPPTNQKGSQILQPSPQMLPSVSGDQR